MARTEGRYRKSHPSDRMRRRALAEWRGYYERPDPDRNIRTAAEAIGLWAKTYGLQQGVAEEELRRAWAGIVGPFLARHSAPKALRRGILLVSVVQPSVRFALEQGPTDEMLAKLQTRFGADTIREIRFTTV